MPRYYAKTNLRTATGVIPPMRILPDDFDLDMIQRLLKKGSIAEVNEAPQPTVVASNDGSQRVATAHLWNFTDEQLDAPLAHLNIMVQSHVQKHALQPVEPFESRREAVAWMTKDREGGPVLDAPEDDEEIDRDDEES